MAVPQRTCFATLRAVPEILNLLIAAQVASAGAPAPAPVSQAQDAAAEQPSTSGRWIHAELPRELPRYVGKQKKVAVPLMQALEMVKVGCCCGGRRCKLRCMWQDVRMPSCSQQRCIGAYNAAAGGSAAAT